MKIIQAGEAIPNQINKSIFLAGPSLRSHQSHLDQYKQREKAIKILEIYEYDGVVFIPEGKDGNYPENYDTQISQETKCLQMADNILFYINRNIEDELLALTTNDEQGYQKDSGKCFLCTEHGAEHIRYQEQWGEKLKVNLTHSLSNSLKQIIELQGDGYPRIDGERYIPLEIQNLEQFQTQYKQLKLNNNQLQEAKVLTTYRIPSNNKIFAYTLQVNVFIKNENRLKNNEFIFSRTDISTCLLYYPRPNILDTEIVLISEFRSPVNNEKGKVYEIPGGSSHKDGVDPKQTIIEELEEECGFKPGIDKLQYESSKQLAATILTHKAHLYSYKLDNFELELIKSNQGKIFGVETDSERTEVHVVKVGDIINKDYIDFSMFGMILTLLNKK